MFSTTFNQSVAIIRERMKEEAEAEFRRFEAELKAALLKA